jgi:HEAT repeat protein
MSVDQLIDRFEDAAIRKYATRFLAPEDAPCDVELSNRITCEIIDLVLELKSRKAVDRLLPFLDHPNITVRSHAATYCRAIATDRAVSILEAIAASHDPNEAGDAAYILDRWRSGDYGLSAP